MSITVVGSIAYDSVKTPFGERERMLGGTAVHFSLASSFFADVRMVGPVGEDWGESEMAAIQRPGVHTEDVERVPDGKTFFWRGHYDYDLNTAHTDDTQLGVFAEFEPKLSDDSRACEVLFLANIQPELQLRVREQCDRARFVALDSMNLWIDTAREALLRAIETVNCVLLNDAELRMLTGEPNLVKAARTVIGWGPAIGRGQAGRVRRDADHAQWILLAARLPAGERARPDRRRRHVRRGSIGTIAAHDTLDEEVLRSAMAHGTTLASFNVERFGTERVLKLRHTEIEARVNELREMNPFQRTRRYPREGVGHREQVWQDRAHEQ